MAIIVPVKIDPTGKFHVPSENGDKLHPSMIPISTTSPNRASMEADGIYVPPEPAAAFSDDQVFVGVDTNTVDLTFTPGAPTGTDAQVNYNVTADVRVDPSSPVQIISTAAGLAASAVRVSIPTPNTALNENGAIPYEHFGANDVNLTAGSTFIGFLTVFGETVYVPAYTAAELGI